MPWHQSYGDTERRMPPWKLYSRDDAELALRLAEEAYRIAEDFLRAFSGHT